MAFDPYHKWLRIAANEQLASHCRRLATEESEFDLDAIDAVAERQGDDLHSFQTGTDIGMLWLKPFILIMFALLFACTTQAAPPRDKFLTKDGKLSATLTLKDVQGGAAELTGVIWTVRSDGSWDRKRIIGRKTGKPDLSGELTATQLQQIAGVLAHAQMDKLPPRLGKFHGVNPHMVTLAWGKHQCAWTLPPRVRVPKYPDQPFGKLTDEDRFSEIMQTLVKLLKSPKEK